MENAKALREKGGENRKKKQNKGNSCVPFPVRQELSALPHQNSPELLGIRWHLYFERIQQKCDIFNTGSPGEIVMNTLK